MMSVFDTYTAQEQLMLSGVLDCTFLNHASMWKVRHRDMYIQADPVDCGPRRWTITWFPGHDWTIEKVSPWFGNLDSLLVWVKLEGLL